MKTNFSKLVLSMMTVAVGFFGTNAEAANDCLDYAREKGRVAVSCSTRESSDTVGQLYLSKSNGRAYLTYCDALDSPMSATVELTHNPADHTDEDDTTAATYAVYDGFVSNNLHASFFLSFRTGPSRIFKNSGRLEIQNLNRQKGRRVVRQITFDCK